MNDVVTRERIVPMRHGEPWTAAEVAFLRSSYATRRSVATIMATLQRSEQSVRQKASKLQLTSIAERANYRGAYRAAATGMPWPTVRTVFGLTEWKVRRWAALWSGGLPWPPALDIAEAAK